MEASLQELMISNGVSEPECNWLAANRNLRVHKDLANLFDARADVTAWVRGLPGPHNASQTLLTGLKQTWREVDAISQHQINNKTMGGGEDDQAPLPSATARALDGTFRHGHGFNFLPSELGSDPLSGRLRREMERKQPTVSDIWKTRRLVEVQYKPGAKKQKLAANVHLVQDREAEDCLGLVANGDLFTVVETHGILCNTMAHVGTLEFIPVGGAAMPYCCYKEIRRYRARARLAIARGMSHGLSSSQVLAFFLSTDLAHREKWVEIIRGSPDTECFTTALRTTLNTMEPLWQWESNQSHTMHDPSTPQQQSNRSSSSLLQDDAPSGRKPAASAALEGQNRPPMTARFTNDGKSRICKAWCDGRNGKQCSEPCPGKKKHQYCDVLVESNKACGQPHARVDHKGPVYAYVQ